MTLDRHLVEEASEELWKEYHEQIEELGYNLSKNNMMQAIDKISIVATITPKYSVEVGKKIREIFPKEYKYKGENIPVIVFPSMSDMLFL